MKVGGLALSAFRPSFLADGQPDGLTLVLCLDDFLFEPTNPDAIVEHFAHFAVLANEDAAFGVF